MHIGKGYDASAICWGKGGGHPLPQGGAGQHPVCKRKWMQAAQASYSGEAQHQKKVRCATMSIPTLERLRLYSIVSYRIV